MTVFRITHERASEKKKLWDIVILCNIVTEKIGNNIEPELQQYLKSNTYLKWGDPYFWRHLKNALEKDRRPNLQDTNENFSD